MNEAANVKQAVPFFGVRNIDASLRFYVNGLNFTMTHQRVIRRLRAFDDCWALCWLNAIVVTNRAKLSVANNVFIDFSRCRSAP